MNIYYIILFAVAVGLFVLGIIFELLQRKIDSSKLSNTLYSNTGSFSLVSDFEYEKDDDSNPVIIQSVLVEDGLDNRDGKEAI